MEIYCGIHNKIVAELAPKIGKDRETGYDISLKKDSLFFKDKKAKQVFLSKDLICFLSQEPFYSSIRNPL